MFSTRIILGASCELCPSEIHRHASSRLTQRRGADTARGRCTCSTSFVRFGSGVKLSKSLKPPTDTSQGKFGEFVYVDCLFVSVDYSFMWLGQSTLRDSSLSLSVSVCLCHCRSGFFCGCRQRVDDPAPRWRPALHADLDR